MRTLTIFRLIRDKNDNDKILAKRTLRIVNVHNTFEGIGQDDVINKSRFKDLADALEPSNDGISVT